MLLNNLLIASDFSKYSDWALQRVIDLAKKSQSHIHFLHVLTPPLSSISRPADTELQPKLILEKQEIEKKMLRKLKDKSSTISVVLGRATDEIIRYAKGNDCKLIIVGAHGCYYINDYVLGTTCSAIIRKSHLPVLLIKKEPNFSYNRILIATDLSKLSKETVQFTFNCFPKATFQLLHIVDIYYRQFLNLSDLNAECVDIKHPETKKIVEKLDDFLTQCHVDKSKFEKKIISGYYADAIVDQAKIWDADLLAFGTQGKSGLHYLLMGSVAKRILHLSPVDMLVVPPKL